MEGNEVHCSSCDSAVPPGSQFCHSCGVRLIAIAAPAKYVEELRFSALAVIVGAIGILLVIIYAVSK